MQISLVGWRSSGKSTLFTALTGKEAVIGETAHPGFALVPDSRLDRLHQLSPHLNKIPARVEYLDIAGLTYEEEKTGVKRSMINFLQGANVLATVIALFHLDTPDPESLINHVQKDLLDLETEFLLSDMQIAENRLERINADKKRGTLPETAQCEMAILQRILDALNNEQPLRELDFNPEEEKTIRPFAFLTQKPLLIVVNCSDSQDLPAIENALQSALAGQNRAIFAVNARLEAEIALLDEPDRAAFLEELGIKQAASERVIQAGFKLLGMISFFTIGDEEVRAWAIRNGASALEAAGTIHSDMERGFIRAEVIASEDLIKHGSFSACRDLGILRLEGKKYIIQDGEVMHVRFAV